jgi:exosortase A-associated hydrolase 1
LNELIPIAFPCEGDVLLGILHRGNAREPKRALVVVVAGGPQYRVGAHRQFVLLARKLARNGFPVLRFDLRGMGDSGGVHQGFESAESDIGAAIDALQGAEPTVTEVVLFGECESASGSLFYAYKDARVKGLALVNPWVRTEEGQARTYLKHYYARRLLSRDFWRKVFRREFDPFASVRSFVRIAFKARRYRSSTSDEELDDARFRALPLPERTALGFRRFSGQAFVLVSGRDYIAREFDEAISSSPAWHGLMERTSVKRHDVENADHTFSRREWREEASDLLLSWMNSW